MIVLSIPQSVNHLWHCKRGGGFFKNKVDTKWLNDAAVLIRSVYKKPMVRIAVTVGVWYPDKRRRDIDNHCKSLGDAIKASGVIEDDSWQYLCEWHIYAKGIDKKNPRIEIEIESRNSL